LSYIENWDKSKVQLVGGSGVRLLKGLFREAADRYDSTIKAPYTLKIYDDKDGYLSLYLRYIEAVTVDPTEYLFATTYLHDWKHWTQLQKSPFFQDSLREWRAERDALLASILVRKMVREVNGPKGFEATQFLLRNGWSDNQTKSTKGRPSKEMIEKAAHQLAVGKTRVSDDLQRLGLLS